MRSEVTLMNDEMTLWEWEQHYLLRYQNIFYRTKYPLKQKWKYLHLLDQWQANFSGQVVELFWP